MVLKRSPWWQRQAERIALDEHPSGTHSGESAPSVPEYTNNNRHDTAYFCLSSRAASLNGDREDAHLSADIIKPLIYRHCQKGDTRRRERNQQKGSGPKGGPTTICSHKMPLRSIVKWYVSVYAPAVGLSGIHSLSLYFRTERPTKAWQSWVCYQR